MQSVSVVCDDGPGLCELDAEESDKVLRVDNTRHPLTLSGLKISNGIEGGRWLCAVANADRPTVQVVQSQLTAQLCEFETCSSGSQGGALQVFDSVVTVASSIFRSKGLAAGSPTGRCA